MRKVVVLAFCCAVGVVGVAVASNTEALINDEFAGPLEAETHGPVRVVLKEVQPSRLIVELVGADYAEEFTITPVVVATCDKGDLVSTLPEIDAFSGDQISVDVLASYLPPGCKGIGFLSVHGVVKSGPNASIKFHTNADDFAAAWFSVKEGLPELTSTPIYAADGAITMPSFSRKISDSTDFMPAADGDVDHNAWSEL